VRTTAARLGLRTATKPDSQDVCFILGTGGGRETFLGERIALRPGRVVDAAGEQIGSVDAVELVTVGQRRGLNVGGGPPHYALAIDSATATVVAGVADDLLVDEVRLTDLTWTASDLSAGTVVAIQSSAHGAPSRGRYLGAGVIALDEPQRRVAPGQTVALYDGDEVVGAGLAA
jgi:tRNA-specific 2-thiouridylase